MSHWIDGWAVGEGALYSEAERTALAYSGVVIERNRLSLPDIHDDVAKRPVEGGINEQGIGNVVPT